MPILMTSKGLRNRTGQQTCLLPGWRVTVTLLIVAALIVRGGWWEFIQKKYAVGWSSPVSSLGSYPRGRRFKSCPHHFLLLYFLLVKGLTMIIRITGIQDCIYSKRTHSHTVNSSGKEECPYELASVKYSGKEEYHCISKVYKLKGKTVMYTVRKYCATMLMMLASLFKILTVIVAPADLKEEFEESI